MPFSTGDGPKGAPKICKKNPESLETQAAQFLGVSRDFLVIPRYLLTRGLHMSLFIRSYPCQLPASCRTRTVHPSTTQRTSHLQAIPQLHSECTPVGCRRPHRAFPNPRRAASPLTDDARTSRSAAQSARALNSASVSPLTHTGSTPCRAPGHSTAGTLQSTSLAPRPRPRTDLHHTLDRSLDHRLRPLPPQIHCLRRSCRHGGDTPDRCAAVAFLQQALGALVAGEVHRGRKEGKIKKWKRTSSFLILCAARARRDTSIFGIFFLLRTHAKGAHTAIMAATCVVEAQCTYPWKRRLEEYEVIWS